jgi:hypothetical protein
MSDYEERWPSGHPPSPDDDDDEVIQPGFTQLDAESPEWKRRKEDEQV